jgi:hypothetical protein
LSYTVKKSLAIFPSPARISLTKLYLTGNNLFNIFYSVSILPSISPFIGCTKNPQNYKIEHIVGGFLKVLSRAKAAFCIGISMLEISAVGTLKKFEMKNCLELASNIKAACKNYY